MTTKNSILLIVKQNPGIDYNSLLNKFASSYSNLNSARAALSRSLKDLTVFGYLSKRGNNYFLLEKGEAEIYSELKNKLVISLNELLKQKNPHQDIDSIVEKLQIIIERSKEDKALLKTSKSSLDFNISDLEKVEASLNSQIRHLDYIAKVFREQVNSLKELDFNDSLARPLDNASAELLQKIFSQMQETEFVVECSDVQTAETLSSQLNSKHKEKAFNLHKDSVQKLGQAIIENPSAFAARHVTVFSSALKAEFRGSRIIVSGQFSSLGEWKKNA